MKLVFLPFLKKIKAIGYRDSQPRNNRQKEREKEFPEGTFRPDGHRRQQELWPPQERRHERLFNGERLELRSIIWRFTRARSRRKRDWPAKPSIPFPRPKSRGEGSPLFLLSSPSPCYKQPITTIEILSAEYSYGCFIVFFSFISSDNLLSPLDNFAKSFLPRRKNISGAQTFAWTKFYYIE